MKVRDVIKAIEEDGWVLNTTRGDHRQFEHPTKMGKVTVAGHVSDEVPVGTLGNIRKQSGLSNLGRK